MNNKVKVSYSGINRKGVFAVKDIKKDEVIAVWGGYIITQSEYNKLSRTAFKKIDDYATKVADGFYMVSSKMGLLEDDDFFNHSCNPNAGIRGQILMVAMRDIKRGEEITYDYAMTDADFNYSFKCRCKAKNCRGRITTNDWKNPVLQKKYAGFFSFYIQDLITRSRKLRRK
ncbi:MAG: SET domain-containing protein [Candidatus Omnitrophota bacterium]